MSRTGSSQLGKSSLLLLPVKRSGEVDAVERFNRTSGGELWSRDPRWTGSDATTAS